MQHARIFSLNSDKNARPTRSRKSSPLTNTNRSDRLRARMISPAIGSTLTVGSANSDGGSTHARRMIRENTLTVGKDLSYFLRVSDNSGAEKKKRITAEDSNETDNKGGFQPVQLNLTVWFHESRTSSESVVLDYKSIPGVEVGDVFEIVPLTSNGTSRKAHRLIFLVKDQAALAGELKLSTSSNISGNHNTLGAADSSSTNMATEATQSNNDNHNRSASTQESKRLSLSPKNYPIVSDTIKPNPNAATKSPSNDNTGKAKTSYQISLLTHPLQELMDLAPRSTVQLTKISNTKAVEADIIEIFIRDVSLSRDMMWVISSSLVGTSVHMDMRVAFSDKRIGLVKTIYIGGKNTFSAMVSENTRVLFRSKSARLNFLIQLSSEMWHFQESGEIMFHKLINTLFPQIFSRWRNKGTHHVITIVLFTSVDLTNIPWSSLGDGERPQKRHDYYRVVVDQVSIFHWDKIMAALRLEFTNFKREIMLRLSVKEKFEISGAILPSIKGNFLEAVNLVIAPFIDRFHNTDLKHTVSHFIVITPGTGIFDVDHELMNLTSKKVLSTDSSLDLVCLSQQPLHVVPLFRFRDRNNNGQLSHCIPKWFDISFFQNKHTNKTLWIPRCKIYELQMMGVMETEVDNAEIERLVIPKARNIAEAMDAYDKDVFTRPRLKKGHEKNTLSTLKNDSTRNNEKVRKDPKESLSLIRNERTLLPQPLSKIDVSESNSSATGTVMKNAESNSALGSLYTLSKTSEDLPSKGSNNREETNRKEKTLARRRSSNRMSISAKPIDLKLEARIAKKDHMYRMSKQDDDNHDPRKTALEVNYTKPIFTSENVEDTDLLMTKIENPSKDIHYDMLPYLRSSRWIDTFPSNVRRRKMKWRSIESPASLPLTTSLFPSMKSLESDYTFQIYNIVLNADNVFDIRNTYDLMMQMIQLRLMLGFQICYGIRVLRFELEKMKGNNSEELIKYLPNSIANGAKIYLSFGNEIHRIYCDYYGNLAVQLYRKGDQSAEEEMFGLSSHSKDKYYPSLRTRYANDYSAAKFDAVELQPPRYNWNQFDQMLAGYDEAIPSDKKRFFKMKFVILPCEIPKNSFFISNEKLSEEEIRVEGLRRLIATIERGRYIPDNEKKSRKKEEIFPEISFYTGGLYDFLSEQAEEYYSSGGLSNTLMKTTDEFNKYINLNHLAQELQSHEGLKLVDRTWHFKKHQRCFLGNELVSWLIQHFEDIDNREDAMKYGQELMERGLFKHVESRHGFLDGHYFYEFSDDFTDKSSKTQSSSSGWFKRKPANEKQDTFENLNSKTSADDESYDKNQENKRAVSNRVSSISGSDHSVRNEDTQSKHFQKKKFILSRSLRYDADPQKKSFKPEIVTVHYDTVHNPEHCYHIRLQWLNTSRTSIDDTISGWSRVCERYGLRLIETNWSELCNIPNICPFHSIVDIELAVNPWEDDEFLIPEIFQNSKFYYHLYLLKMSDFLLDNRAAKFFRKDDIEISYSWGKPSFRYAQFIHKTGAYILELRESGKVFLAPNNAHISRANSSLSSASEKDNARNYHFDSQQVMLNFGTACTNEKHLRGIFREAKEKWQAESRTGMSFKDL